jgi:hypothetical protein
VNLYLVEEHTVNAYGTPPERIPFAAIVETDSHVWAFQAANELSQQVRVRSNSPLTAADAREVPSEFLFDASELTEVIQGYLWMAEDGSDIWYEVRCLGTVQVGDNVKGHVIRGALHLSKQRPNGA